MGNRVILKFAHRIFKKVKFFPDVQGSIYSRCAKYVGKSLRPPQKSNAASSTDAVGSWMLTTKLVSIASKSCVYARAIKSKLKSSSYAVTILSGSSGRFTPLTAAASRLHRHASYPVSIKVVAVARQLARVYFGC